MTQPTPTRISGPAQMSQRTDGGQPIRHIADAKYGEDKAFVQQQKGAPLADGPARPETPTFAGSPAPTGLVGPGPSAPPPEITPLSAPTAYPGQPVTTGMQMGSTPPRPPKPDMQPGQLSNALRPYIAADDTGVLGELAWNLAQMGL